MTARFGLRWMASAAIGALALASCGGGGAQAAPCVAGLVTESVPLPAGVRVPENHVDVLLPAGYCRRPLEHYPVLYLLHGAGDTYRSWSAQTDLVRFASSFPLIVVMPDGGRLSTATWYSNWLSGRYQEETYLTSVLPRFVSGRFRVRRGDAAVAGNSMGGFGAMSLAARHPGLYRVAGSFSGALDMLYDAPASGKIFASLAATTGTPGLGVWGPQTSDRAVWAAHNPTDLAARLSGLRLFVASGTGTRGGPQGDLPGNSPAYLEEAGIRLMNDAFVAALQAAHIPFTNDLYQGGYHGWPYWQAGIRWALPQLAASLGRPLTA